MKCPAAERWMLLLDGALSRREAERLERHREACPRCAAEMARLRGLDFLLAAAGPAGRRVCPPRETLVAFAEGELSPRERVPFAAHLERCHVCREELGDWQSLVGRRPRDSIWAMWRDGLAATFALGALARVRTARAPARASRGGAGSVRFTRAWDGDEIEISLPVDSRQDRQDLTLRLRPFPADPLAVRAELIEDGQVLEARTLGEDGRVVFDGIRRGTYLLRLRDMLGRRTLEVELHVG